MSSAKFGKIAYFKNVVVKGMEFLGLALICQNVALSLEMGIMFTYSHGTQIELKQTEFKCGSRMKQRPCRQPPAPVSQAFMSTAEAAPNPVSYGRPAFDFRARLSHPPNHAPHKGKLKPQGRYKENNSLSEQVSRVSLHRKTTSSPIFAINNYKIYMPKYIKRKSMNGKRVWEDGKSYMTLLE